MELDGNHNLVRRLREITANYDAIGEAADRIEELERALTFIASHSGQTLISVEHGQPYSIGANAAFESMAATAKEAL